MYHPYSPNGRFLLGKNVAVIEEVQVGEKGDKRGDVEGGIIAKM
jgi:hypothetical protein